MTLHCPNQDCPAKHIKGFDLFVSRNALNIDGLSEATLEKFIDAGFDVNHKISDSYTLLSYAVYINPRTSFMKNLLSLEGLDINCSESEHNVLKLAIDNENLSIIKLLVDCGADVNSSIEYYSSTTNAIGYAILRKMRMSFINTLINAADADINAFEMDYPCVIAAINAGDLEALQALIAAGANVNVKTNYYSNQISALEYAVVCKGRLSIINTIIEAPNFDALNLNAIGGAFKRAIDNDDAEIIETLIEKGFSVDNLQNMRNFYLIYSKYETPSRNLQMDFGGIQDSCHESPRFALSWSHYLKLMRIENVEERNFYEIEATANHWSLRELERQYDSSLYERLALSRNKDEVLQLSRQGQIIEKPQDLLKDPYILEFTGLPELPCYSEKDLEQKLIDNLQSFLLELGKGFMFVGTQQRITLGNEHYYVDMVFYNKILHSYVLIELKTKKLMPAAVGQLNMYLNYYAEEVNEESDNPPIGIILCTDRDFLGAEYALGGLNNYIFASKYTYVIPNKEELIAQVEAVLEKMEGRKDV